MANSGFFNTNSVGNFYITFNWWINWQDIPSNTTEIGWNYVAHNSPGSYRTIYPRNVYIDGTLAYSGSNALTCYDGTIIASGTWRHVHSNDGSKWFSASANAGIGSTSINSSGSGSWDLPTIPRQSNITGANNFNDEQNPYMTFSNPGGFALNARLEFAGVNIQRNDIPNTGNYTFVLTQAERNLLLSKCTNSNTLTVRYVVATKQNGGEAWWSFTDRTMTVINANPTFVSSNITYLDSNTTVTAITGNNQRIVRNNSNLKVTISSATALKSSSIAKYQATINGVTKEITAPGTIDFGIVNASSNLTLSVKAIDSRGNVTSANKSVIIDDWILPSALIELNRLNNYEDTTYLKVDGTISSVNNKNAITIKYQYKKTGDTVYSTLNNIADNTKITLNILKAYAWDFRIIVADKFGTTTYNLTLAKGMPIMFIDVKKLSVGINCFPVSNNSLEVNGQEMLGYDIVDTW